MIAQQQHEADKQSALDQQQATILQTYIDNIQDLLLNHNLLKSKSGDNVATLARARTLTALQGLDPKRRGVLVQFLYQAKLISKSNVIVDLSGADLSNADLSDANLGGANLNGVNLDEANLSNVNLSEAILSGAILDNADLHYANLFKATLTYFNVVSTDETNTKLTFLRNSDLKNANLSSANLEGALLYGADLIEASLGGAKLDGAKYNTKAVQGKDAHGRLEFDDQGKPFMIKPTSWSQGFDPRVAMAFCVDC